MRDRLDYLEQHKLRGKQPQRPLRTSFGWCAACQVHELGLCGPIELARVRARLRRTLYRRHQPLHHARPSRPFDRRHPDPQLLDDLLIRRTGVRVQQNPCAPGAACLNPTTADHRFECRSLVVRELDDVALHSRLHPRCPRDGPRFHPSPGA